MSRRLAREVVLQSVFQIDFNECTVESALTSSLEEHEEFAWLEMQEEAPAEAPAAE